MTQATDDDLKSLWDHTPTRAGAMRALYDLGIEHGRQQAADRDRPLWPTPITHRPPTEADGDERGWVMVDHNGVWRPWQWDQISSDGWQHMPRWKPKPPTLKEQALAILDLRGSVQPFVDDARRILNADEISLIRRALEAQP